MGYRRIPTVYTLDSIPEAEGLVVRMASVRIGKMRKMMQLTSDTESGDEGISELLNLFAESLISWNLEDESGAPVPATIEGIEEQEIEFVMDIIGAWMERMTGTSGPDDLGKDSTGGERFPGQPLTMEAL